MSSYISDLLYYAIVILFIHSQEDGWNNSYKKLGKVLAKEKVDRCYWGGYEGMWSK